MQLDTKTLIFILSLILITQVIALFIQYQLENKPYRGIGWWLSGACLMVLGVLFMPLVNVESLRFLAMVANPFMVLGQVFFYIGIVRFFNQKENRYLLGTSYVVFLLIYYYFIFIDNDISSRTIVINSALALISFLTLLKLISEKDQAKFNAAKFTAVAFLVYGIFLTVRVIYTVRAPSVQTYIEQGMLLKASFIIPVITSNLWTFGLVLMINQRLNIENLLEKEKMRLIFNTGPDAAMITRLHDGAFVDVNGGFSTIFGYTREEVLQDHTAKICVWNQNDDRQQFIIKLKEQGICENMEYLFKDKKGQQFYGIISARKILIQGVPHSISVIRDITKRREVEQALMESEEQYRSILNASPDDITITDLEGYILMISPAAKQMFGYEESFNQFVGMHILDFIVPEDVERAKANIQKMYHDGASRPNEYHGVRQDGSTFDIEVNSGFVRNPNGEPIRMVFIVRDITERKIADQQIQALVQQLEIEKNTAQLHAMTDSLTGLSNRRYFDLVLKTEFYRLRRSKMALSLIMLDIDHFKKFNDTYGHLNGDECLKKIGDTLRAIVGRTTDTVARFGGEEFIVILPETDAHGAINVAERIRSGVESLKINHSASDTAPYVTVSLGVVSVNPSNVISPKHIVETADKALYAAKNNGRNRMEVIDESNT
ncbi:hypothetical protein GCM10012290_18750 [Halolactibacillus alkaliphilus]|uniref:Diguanylate cyclase n=1 Tax=Halolactibacillus alkaliphilus TaxID=442899 RepID=A0A511X2N8_9BACI|nr:diguanylate cyclase [Halolactibacillus alkaliphilus]GEN57203.1 hypothetical protein HAL01_16670 [Halolactibacillus alkaliphilus]GGN72610.1 hypothetical protein GCM10012290_18750 [Halolactibacillus alkaliphilus]SFO90984.1 PAS domain S-box-containing protein/diguanylate cyclase (GGDEF) domain-containing protein [Halolactibacillus alkaliphilus]